MIHYVICTQKTEEDFWNDERHDSIKDCSCSLFVENKKGLGECYNELADNDAIDDDTFLIFMHDDIRFNDFSADNSHILEILEDSEFDVIGLAGTSSWSLKSPVLWNNSERSKWSGKVWHSHEGKEWPTDFGPIGRRCIIVDGLFIAVKKGTFKQILFDPQFTFHHYDIDFCLSAHKKGFTIGTEAIEVTHYSVGDWREDPVWYKSEKLFIEKWSKNVN